MTQYFSWADYAKDDGIFVGEKQTPKNPNFYEIDVYLNGELVGRYTSMEETARFAQCDTRTVKKVLDGDLKHFQGYTFKKHGEK